MSPAFSRREMLRTLAGSGLVLGVTRTRADDRPVRKFTKDLVCGNIGVSARLPEAIAMAHRHGFESVAPDIGYLKSISDSQLSELRDDLKAKNLVWGGAGLSVNFRGGQAAIQDGLRGLADDAKALLGEVGGNLSLEALKAQPLMDLVDGVGRQRCATRC